jgi:hypothetical protein
MQSGEEEKQMIAKRVGGISVEKNENGVFYVFRQK